MDNLNEQKKIDLRKLKLIVGLGNKGKDYQNTRHNVGFMLLDFLTQEEFYEEEKFKAYCADYRIDDHKILLAKPTTMMNLSGESLNQLTNFFRIDPEEILVVHDDLDIAIGEYKLHFAKGPKVHNGILSIEEAFSTDQFWRCRIGIENRDSELRKKFPGEAYVLSKFSEDEMKAVDEVFTKVKNELIGQT